MLETFSVHTKYYCEEPGRNLKKVCPVWTLHQAAEITETMPVETAESAPAAWFKKVRESNASIDGIHLKEKALHITSHLGIANFSASNPMDGSADLTGDKTLFTEIY
jgi:hypothetical protein